MLYVCICVYIHFQLKAGVARVVIGSRDPNSHVNGGGVKLLEDAGVSVECKNWMDKLFGHALKTIGANLVCNLPSLLQG
jgi:pyrimidine deaminase RibD-like protein